MTEKHEPESLGAAAAEIKHGTFLGNAMSRSSRRKSPWNFLLLLIFPLWGWLLIEGVQLARMAAILLLRGHSAPVASIWASAIAPFLIYPPMIVATMLMAMVLINWAIYLLIPPARRAMDNEDKPHPGTEYATQQPMLVRLALIVVPVAFLLAVVGEIFL